MLARAVRPGWKTASDGSAAYAHLAEAEPAREQLDEALRVVDVVGRA